MPIFRHLDATPSAECGSTREHFSKMFLFVCLKGPDGPPLRASMIYLQYLKTETNIYKLKQYLQTEKFQRFSENLSTKYWKIWEEYHIW